MAKEMEITIEASGISDLKITCDAIPEDMAGKAIFVRPRESLPYRQFRDIMKSLKSMFPDCIVVIVPPNLTVSIDGKAAAIEQIEDLLKQVRGVA